MASLMMIRRSVTASAAASSASAASTASTASASSLLPRGTAAAQLLTGSSTAPTGRRGMGHTVRIIVREDLPNGKAYANEVIEVKAGYARNLLVPQKMACYATRENFRKLGLSDPDRETAEQRSLRVRREQRAAASSSPSDEADLKAADLLRHYLRNKTLKIWRNVSDDAAATLSPGMVDAAAVRKKLSKQLLIDLESGETIHLTKDPVVHLASYSSELSDDEILRREFLLMNGGGDATTGNEPCQVQIRQPGEFLARITLRGGHTVPLRVEILKR